MMRAWRTASRMTVDPSSKLHATRDGERTVCGLVILPGEPWYIDDRRTVSRKYPVTCRRCCTLAGLQAPGNRAGA